MAHGITPLRFIVSDVRRTLIKRLRACQPGSAFDFTEKTAKNAEVPLWHNLTANVMPVGKN
jgi:hypothetical protein